MDKPLPLALACLAIVASTLSVPALEQTVFPIPNGDFEQQLEGWRIEEKPQMATLSTEQAVSGTHSLKILDMEKKHGSNAWATRIPIQGAGLFKIRGKYFGVRGNGLGIYVRVRDAEGREISDNPHAGGLGGNAKTWQDFAFPIYTTADAASLELWIHSYGAAVVEGYLDDLHFVKLEGLGNKPPWEGSYKIKPAETERLTAADVVGPDGIVYPDWTWCGIKGGIPDVKVAADIAEFGGFPDDDMPDHEALALACRAAGQRGGGAVQLEAGTYYLDRPVTVRHNNVVIRGRGQGRTQLIFRYALPESGIVFYNPKPGDRIGKDTLLELHCHPDGLAKMTISLGGVLVREWVQGAHSGNSFSVGGKAWKQADKIADGVQTLTGAATYHDGSSRKVEIPVLFDKSFDRDIRPAHSRGAIWFTGRGPEGPKIKLAEDGKRGDTELVLEEEDAFQPGDRIMIDGPATKRWKELTSNACRWGSYRRSILRVEAVNGRRITVNQPLRIEFPVIDGSNVRKLHMIEGCGIEDLTIEQTENLWISTAVFHYGWECWARNVTVKKCGQFPVYGRQAKFCEFRNCVFDDAWFKGGGGTAYAGWEVSWDCLIDGIETFKLRHAPLFQWSASGCVIRNGVFHESDAQWHSGWTNENLMENCVINAKTGNGAYGFGFWASPPEDTAHGPNGPRNVVYNCDCTSAKTGLWMGGMNENWLILYNRFVVEKGQGVFAKSASFDHIIKGNVFVLKHDAQPMIRLQTPDCIGVEATDNTLYGGNGKIVSGLADLHVNDGNRALPLQDAPRPTPPVPSIFEWQRANVTH